MLARATTDTGPRGTPGACWPRSAVTADELCRGGDFAVSGEVRSFFGLFAGGHRYVDLAVLFRQREARDGSSAHDRRVHACAPAREALEPYAPEPVGERRSFDPQRVSGRIG